MRYNIRSNTNYNHIMIWQRFSEENEMALRTQHDKSVDS